MRFSASFSEADLSFSELNSYDLIQLKGAELLGEPGEPLLPQKIAMVAVPSGAEVRSLRITSLESKELEGEFRIYPAQPDVPISQSERARWVEPDQAIYGSSRPLPDVPAELGSQGSLAGHWIAGVRLHPVRYLPKEGKVILFTRIDFELELGGPQSSVPVRVRSAATEGLLRDVVRSLVINPDQVREKVGTGSHALDAGEVEYLIVTVSPLVGRFQELADWKTLKGVPAEVVSAESIYANYSGRDNAERIRNCIIDYYTNKGLVWVLLGGDVNVVPYRGCYGRVGSEIDNTMPCDLYFSDLDGDFNADGDNIWGETSDNVDLYPDVFVGRAPVSSMAECSLLVRKMMIYENVLDGTPIPQDYQLKMLYLAEWLDASTDAGLGKNIIDNAYVPSRYDPISKLYESLGNINKQIAVDSMNTGFAIVNHSGHSNYGAMSVGPNALTRGDMSGLTNDPRFTVCYSIGCIAAGFEDNDCIAERFVLAPNGGGYFVGNSRYGWYSPGNPGGGSSERYDQMFFSCLYDDTNARLGMAQAISKTYYISWSMNNGAYRWGQFCLNLLGEPENFVWTDTPDTFEPVYPLVIGTSTPQFDVSVLADGIPVASALVCIMKDGEVYLHDYTSASGLVSFSLPAMTPGVMNVTITGHNYLPHRGTTTVVEAPAIPAYIVPADGAVSGDMTPTFVWSGTAGPGGDYTLEYSEDRDFAVDVVTVPDIADTAYTTPDASPLSDAVYYWRVQALDINGFPSGYESNPWFFIVDTTPPEISNTYEWPDTTFTGPYFVETVVKDLSGVLGAYLAYRTDADTIWKYREMALLSPQGVYYRFIPEQACGTIVSYYISAADMSDPVNTATDPAGAPSLFYSFQVLPQMGIELTIPALAPPRVFLVTSPNPARSSVGIEYGLPEDSVLELEVFDSSGRLVRTLADGLFSAGAYRATWDGRTPGGEAVPDGIYYARLSCAGKSIVSKMIMIR
jgi:hypothetical protein